MTKNGNNQLRIGMLDMEKYDNRRPDTVGSSRIRGRWMRKYCPEIVEFEDGVPYDVVIYQKAYYKEHMERFKGIKIFDLCDPDWMEGRPITEVLDLVDAVTVPTEPLKAFLGQLTDKPVVVIPDRIDPDVHTPVKEAHTGKARSVVWFGYSTNQVVLEQPVGFLKDRILALAVISDRPYRLADINIVYKQETINEELIKHDMVIMPDFKADLRHRFKSPNKTLTSWALKMPVAVSPEDIIRFMDPAERQKEADIRYNEVMENHHVRLSGPQYLQLIEELRAKREVSTYGK